MFEMQSKYLRSSLARRNYIIQIILENTALALNITLLDGDLHIYIA